MDALARLDGIEWWHVAGWTMLHFLWLGALAGIAAGVCRLVLRRAPANVRYAVALICLAVLAALPVGIAVWIGAKPQAMQVATNPVNVPPMEIAPSAPGSAGGLTGALSAERPESATRIVSQELAVIPNPIANPRQSRGLTDAVAVIAGYLPWAWVVGTPLTFVLLATGVVGAERLRRTSRVIVDGPIAEACARIVESLRIGRQVTVAVCERIASPVLVGIVRPIILLPPAALTGWSPDEIEMVLLHELAHVRRWDNLVNLIQRFVESLLFFHPAVWLVSSWVRSEREACCDAVVVGRTHQPHAYAEMLVALAAQMPRSVLFHPAASSAMAAGPLRGRIRRILGLQDDPMLVSGKSLGVVMGGLLVVATLLVLNLPQPTTAEEPAPKSAAKIDKEAEMRQAIARVEATNQLKYLALALHNYHDAKGALPAVASFDADGQPLLSWRVQILPYLDGNATGGGTAAELYKEFHLDEPWDSEHNRKLIPRMPAVFRNPTSANSKGSGFTNYLAVVGPDCVFDGSAKGIKFSQIPDGTSNTIMVVEADEAVEWTKPDDFDFNPEMPKAGLGAQRPNCWLAAFADGSIHRIKKNEPDEKVRDLFTCGRKAPSPGSQELTAVPFVVGANRFANGDAITIVEVRGTSDTFEPGNTYQIVGKYTLGSRERAQLSAYTTAKNAAEGTSPTRREQTTTVERGSGTFTLTLPMTVRGWPHVSFYPADGGEGFGGVYFGTGDSVLKKWWDSKEGDSPAAKKFPTLEDQKLADLAWKRLGIELEPIRADELRRVNALGYEGGVSVSGTDRPGGQKYDANRINNGDILVGLHIWPTKSLQDVATALNRDDLTELSPLKYYVVRRDPSENDRDHIFTGRISVPPSILPELRPSLAPQRPQPYEIYAPIAPQPAQSLPVPTIPNAVEPVSRIPAAQAPMAQIVVDPREIALDPNIQWPNPEPRLPPPALAAPAPDSLTEPAKQLLKAAGGVRIEFFYHPDSEPCTKAAKLIPKYEKEFADLVKVERINVAENPAAAKAADVDRVPTFKLYLGERSVMDRTGEMTVEQLNSTLSNIARHVSRVKQPPELRYAGKTFDEWRTIWQTELSLERRLEVVKALAAFGASGRGKEAAQAILDVANQLDWTSIDYNSPAGKLKQGCIDAFTTGQSTEGYRIPVKDWWPLVVPIYENSPEKSTIVTYLSYQLPAGEKELIPKLLELSDQDEATRNLAMMGLKAVDPGLTDERVMARLRRALQDPKAPQAELWWAMSHLLASGGNTAGGGMGGGGGMAPRLQLRMVPELQPLLFHPEQQVRQQARFTISNAQPKDAAALVEQLKQRIDMQGDGRDRKEAIRALAALGQRATPAEDSLRAIALNPKDSAQISAAAALLAMWPDIANWGADEKLNKLFGPETTNQADLSDLMRKLETEQQEIFGVYTPSPVGGGGGVF